MMTQKNNRPTVALLSVRMEDIRDIECHALCHNALSQDLEDVFSCYTLYMYSFVGLPFHTFET